MSPSSNKPKLIIVSGLAASGKTFIAKHIASCLQLFLVSKDEIKELLYDSLELSGAYNLEWSKKLTTASMLLMYQLAEKELELGRSCIIESPFYPKFSTPDILKIYRKYPFNPVQILCYAQSMVLVERFKNRAESGTRHPAHLDAYVASDPAYMARFSSGKAEVMDIGGEVIEVDTTDFEKVDLKSLVAKLSQ